jgi:CRISPR-associated protein Cas1
MPLTIALIRHSIRFDEQHSADGAMDDIHSGDLKTILHSKRANLYYLEHCRVLVKGGRVEYVTEAGKQSQYWNIPIANTTSVLLGTGTSITQLAMRKLAQAGVLVGFCGGGGTPLFTAQEADIEVAWFQPQSEYRATEYLQRWVSFWFKASVRVDAAKRLQHARLAMVERQWRRLQDTRHSSFPVDLDQMRRLLEVSKATVDLASDVETLLQAEARLTKDLYRLAARAVKLEGFTRAKRGEGVDKANGFLDHGNYLAYGLGATAAWVLGLPHGLAVLHGKTRRGGLVFDIADLVKDAIVLPLAFVSAARGDIEQEFRHACIDAFAQTEALDFMIETIKEIALGLGEPA